MYYVQFWRWMTWGNCKKGPWSSVLETHTAHSFTATSRQSTSLTCSPNTPESWKFTKKTTVATQHHQSTARSKVKHVIVKRMHGCVFDISWYHNTEWNMERSWYSFTVPLRVEGWVNLGTAVTKCAARAQSCVLLWFSWKKTETCPCFPLHLLFFAWLWHNKNEIPCGYTNTW